MPRDRYYTAEIGVYGILTNNREPAVGNVGNYDVKLMLTMNR